MRRGAGVLLLLATAAACAQPGSPPGGDIDRYPPRVIAVTPQPFDTIGDLSQPVVIQFDERLSERLEGVTDAAEAVLVSPETGEVRVERNRRSVEVSVEGGWRPNLVYRVVVQPVFRDLFQNLRTEPTEVVFSTGAPIHESALAGFVLDRLTGEPAAAARVRATRRIDATTYVAVSDSAGFFALRYVPAGTYDLHAWQDQDRDREADFFEPGDSAQVTLAFGDTAVVEVSLLPGDSTPAQLARADAIDTLTLELLFDDYFAPGPVDGRGEVLRFDDSTRVATGRLLHGSRLDSLRAARAPADTRAADTADALAPPPDTARDAEPSRALPSRELLLLLDTPLAYDSVYYVVVDGVTNLNGVRGGGGSTRFQMPAPPPPDTAAPAPPADTAADPGGRPPDATRP